MEGKSGLDLDARRTAVARFLGECGQLVADCTEIESGRRDDNRPQHAALAECRKRRAVLLICPPRLTGAQRRVPCRAEGERDRSCRRGHAADLAADDSHPGRGGGPAHDRLEAAGQEPAGDCQRPEPAQHPSAA